MNHEARARAWRAQANDLYKALIEAIALLNDYERDGRIDVMIEWELKVQAFLDRNLASNQKIVEKGAEIPND